MAVVVAVVAVVAAGTSVEGAIGVVSVDCSEDI
jgi:hypothetical protein